MREPLHAHTDAWRQIAIELSAYYKTASDMKPMLTMFEIK